jgi:hypothetical protein
MHTDIHAFSGIQTHDPSVRTSEDSSCVRWRSHCDRPSFNVPQLYLQKSILEHESWPHTTVIAEGIVMLFVVMTWITLLSCVAYWRELQDWISTFSRIISPYLTLYHGSVGICECVLFAFYPVNFTSLYITPIKTPLCFTKITF